MEESTDHGNTIETWHAPRGTKTKVVAWVIIALFLACIVVMIFAIFGGPSS